MRKKTTYKKIEETIDLLPHIDRVCSFCGTTGLDKDTLHCTACGTTMPRNYGRFQKKIKDVTVHDSIV